jgi:hypothetical protein
MREKVRKTGVEDETTVGLRENRRKRHDFVEDSKIVPPPEVSLFRNYGLRIANLTRGVGTWLLVRGSDRRHFAVERTLFDALLPRRSRWG